VVNARQKRVGVISQWYDPEPGVAGVICRSLAARGFETHVLTGFPNYPGGQIYPGYRIKPYQYENLADVHVHRIPMIPSHDRSARRRAATFLSYAASAATRLKILRSVDAWLVYSSPATAALPAMITRALFGRPYVLLIQDLWPQSVVDSGFVPPGRALRVIERGIHVFCDASYRQACAIAVTAPGMADILRDRGVPADKITFIPNWVDETHYRPVPRDDTLARQLGLDGFMIMYAGNLGGFQGLETAIEAVKQLRDLPDLRLVFVGSGVAEPSLRAAAEGMHNVIFLGQQPGERMPQLLALGDVQLISLMDLPLFHSTLPSKLQSTLASGRPIIGCVPGDAARIIEESGAGLTVPPGDARSLADAIRRLHALGPEACDALGRAGRQFYLERMSSQVGGAALASLLESAVKESADLAQTGLHQIHGPRPTPASADNAQPEAVETLVRNGSQHA
jgi:glycosyltransferase involved in cell wall biosynthesis